MASSKATVAVVLFLVLSVAQALKVYTLAGTGEIGTSGDGSLGYYAKASPMRVAVDNVRKVLYFSDFQTIRAVNLTNGIVYRVAGTTQGFSGDNDLAVNAKLNNPAGLCVDTNGNLYIADSGNNRIRLVTLSSGNITTYAGTGTAAFGGDNGNRLSASMNSPSDVACDPSGRLFIADTENSRVRVVSASGTMTTFAGTAGSGYNGDGIAATSAKLNYPVGIAYDASLGHLVIADTLNYRIRVVDSGTIQTIAGTGTGAYSDNGNSIQSGTKYPVSVTYLGQRKVLFADRLACVVRLVDYSDQTISTFLGVPNSCAFNGDSTSDVAQIKEPQSVQYDQVNNVAYIADKDNYRVRGVADTVPSFVPTGATTTTVSPSSPVSSPSPGSASPSPASPSPASSGSPVSSTAPVIVSNSLVAWGDNPYSFFGIDTSAPAVLVPTKVVSSVDMDIIHVSASGASSMFVTSDNKVYVSGDNSLGQL
jgi:sugar lactone lactonase YvrE